MSRSEDPYHEDELRDENRSIRDEEPGRIGDGLFPSAYFPFSPWPPFSGTREPDDEVDDGVYDDDRMQNETYDDRVRGETDDNDGWLGEGLATLLIVVGVVLFLFPEPATSGIGILLIGIGVLAWLFDLAM